jgi:acyl-CoA reductase-like NAD-dependent aldehyde dehydrogenase
VSETNIQGLIAHFPSTDQTVPITNPVNGKKIYDLPQLSEQQVIEAIDKARLAQPSWQKVSVAERAKVLRQTQKLMIADEAKLLDLLQLETGKSRAHAFEETVGAIAAAGYNSKVAVKALARQKTKSGIPVLTKTFVDHFPVGVVGVITPWNYPLALTMLDVLPALVAGNAVVQKADNQSALTVLFARHLAIEAGLPAEVWTVVVGDGEIVGNAVTDHVDYVAFTGSTATGRKVAKRAAARLIGCSLELGGKNPMIVLESANVKRAAEIAMAGAFGSAGQLCVSIERVYVPNRMKEEFLSEIAKRTNSLNVGKSNDFSMDIGSLTGYSQLQRVTGFIDDAVTSGATVIAGGKALSETGPYFYSPTVLTNVNANARMYRQEVFGPVIAVEGYDDLDDAIAWANDSDFGLNASVVGDERDALKVAEKLNAGGVNINEGYRASFASNETPMGGTKSSGQGRRNGIGGILRYTEARAIGISRGAIKIPTRAKQYNQMAPLMRILVKLIK